MSEDIFVFDKVLSLIFEETKESDIDPVVYAVKYCELLKNEVDLYEISSGEKKFQNYSNLIEEIDKFQSKCVENCRTNYTILRQNLSNVVRDTLELQKMPKSKEKLEKTYEIRKVSIQLRRDVLGDNLVFFDKINGQ